MSERKIEFFGLSRGWRSLCPAIWADCRTRPSTSSTSYGLINVPVERASTILFDNVEELERASPGLGQWNYGLQGTETHWALSEALTEFEPGAAGTALYSSGLAAISGALLAVLTTGDELLVVDSVYGPTRKLCDTIL